MQREGFKIAGYAIRTTNQNYQAMQDIGALWTKILAEHLLENIPNKNSHEIIALYYDYVGDQTQPYTCLIGAPVDQIDHLPFGVTGVIVPQQTYQIFTAKGKMPEAVIQAWQDIWQSTLKRSYRFDFEVYDKKSFSEQPEVEIWIGIAE